MGWSKDLGPTYLAGRLSAFLLSMIKTLSIFVDESGDFGELEKHSPYYLITMVFHDQNIDLSKNIRKLDSELDNLNMTNHLILNVTMAISFSNHETGKINPLDYKLFQVADLVCAIELINEKIKTKDLTKSEEYIFHIKSDFKKDFYKKYSQGILK